MGWTGMRWDIKVGPWFYLCIIIFEKFLFTLLLFLFLTALGLRCCMQALSSCGEWGLLFVAVCGLLTAVVSLVLEHRFKGVWASAGVVRGHSSCGAWAYLPHGMWDLPGPGIQPVSPALAGGFSATGPPGKTFFFFFF